MPLLPLMATLSSKRGASKTQLYLIKIEAGWWCYRWRCAYRPDKAPVNCAAIRQ
ncbi:hypothetical protein KCP74_21025 [Salmonella enterica subsp. enterica]|nr:hypothetical protein KCP74_21025 [Salmonella enterica subsp. enterica]